MFKELYYWMYYYLRQIKTNKTPAFNAYVIICALNGMNIETLAAIVNYFAKIDGTKFSAVYVGGGLAGILYIINYFSFYSKRKDIFEKHDKLEGIRKTKGQIYFWLYIVLTFVIFFLVVANLVTPHQG